MKKVTFVLFFAVFSIAIQAQNKIINNSGNTSSITKPLESFTKLLVDVNADIVVKMGGMPMIEIKGDSRIIKHLKASNNKGLLKLETEEGYWLQGSKPTISITVPFLNKLTTEGSRTGIGTISLKDINVEDFEVDMLWGDISMSGSARNLLINSSNRSLYKKRGTLDATSLQAANVEAHIYGSNSAQVNVTNNLSVDLKYDAALSYIGSPSITTSPNTIKNGPKSFGVKSSKTLSEPTIKSPKIKLTYVTLTIKNNTALRKHFIIAGPNPKGKTFSYGFPMNPFAKREERVPVGTKFYSQALGMRGKTLLVVTKDNNGETVNLF